MIFSLPTIAQHDGGNSSVDDIIVSMASVESGSAAFNAFCSLQGFFLTSMHPMAIWTICCLNCDRFYAIAAPLHYGAIVNTKRVRTIVNE